MKLCSNCKQCFNFNQITLDQWFVITIVNVIEDHLTKTIWIVFHEHWIWGIEQSFRISASLNLLRFTQFQWLCLISVPSLNLMCFAQSDSLRSLSFVSFNLTRFGQRQLLCLIKFASRNFFFASLNLNLNRFANSQSSFASLSKWCMSSTAQSFGL